MRFFLAILLTQKWKRKIDIERSCDKSPRAIRGARLALYWYAPKTST
jgi:hypothetical protein